MQRAAAKLCILGIDYFMREDKPVVRIWGKTDKGESIVVFDSGFVPYFYIEAEITPELKREVENIEIGGQKILRIEEVEKKIYGKPTKLLKVYVQKAADVSKFRDAVKDRKDVKEEYEYSISFYKRYLIDKGLIPVEWIEVRGEKKQEEIDADTVIEADEIKRIEKEGYPELRVLAFDIECIEEDDKIIAISVMDNSGYKKVLTHGKGKKTRNIEVLKGEKEMIERFADIVRKRDPDIIVGYNTDRYDFIKLTEKADKHRTKFILSRDGSEIVFKRRGRISSAYIAGRLHLDIYDFIEHILGSTLSSEILTLDMVSKELLGKGKEKMTWEDIEKAWKKRDLKKIAKYCLKDSELALELSKYIIPQVFELSRVVGQTPFDVARMTYSQLVEWLLIRRAFEENEIIPNTPKYDEIERRRKAPPYTGGYVQLPKPGIHKKIALFDFQSLYPSITITHNISPETLNCKCCEGNPKAKVPGEEHHFCLKKKGFIPKIIEELIKKRNELKEKMKHVKRDTPYYKSLYNRQYAVKILTNSSYGYYAYPGSRWYSRVCAQSIAAWGRYYIKRVMEMAEKEGVDVIYGDTDSLFIIMRNKEHAKRFLSRVNKSLPGVMELEFRDMYKTGIFVPSKTGTAAKKKYALLDYKGNIVVRGFEKVRRDWAGIAKKTQEKVIEIILKEGSPEKAVKIVKETIKKLREGKIKKQDLIIYTQLTKELGEYEAISPHVAVAKKLIESGRNIRTGSTIRYVITSGEGSISFRAEPAEFAGDYDPEYYIRNQVVPAALRVLSAFGYTEKDILEDKKKFSLEGFFRR
ncbi:MAG: DNA polymerase [Candidatus Aenigmatarchaeota archaeon]|nr:MAG: DNA polymerase [Candidatus Aenigmarchaeota archaeon]